MPHYETDHSTAPPWNLQTTTVMWVLFTVLLVFLLFAFRSVIPFAFGAVIIAYLLSPFTSFLQRRITFGNRALATTITVLLLVIIVLSVILTIVPALISQTIDVAQSALNLLETLLTEPLTWAFNDTPIFADPETNDALSVLEAANRSLEAQGFTSLSEWLEERAEVLLNFRNLQQLLRSATGVTSALFGSAVSFFGSAFGLALNSLLFLVILASLLAGGRNIILNIVDAAPDDYRSDLERLIEDLGAVWSDYVRGNLILGGIVGSAMWLFATILGLPNPLFLAVFAGLMEFVPNIGPTFSWLAVVSFALGGGAANFPEMTHVTAAVIAGIYGFIVLQVEGLFLVPQILGDSLSLHPIIVILSVLWGVSLGGIIGVLIAPPLVASIRIVVHYIYGRLTNRTAFHTRKQSDDDNNQNKLLQRASQWINNLRTRQS